MNKAYVPSQIFGLVGYPLGHSWSPVLHKAAYTAVSLDADYRLYEINTNCNPDTELQFLIQQMRLGKIHGLNITIPYKEKIVQYLDEILSDAGEIGAVNTIVRSGNQIIGYNTDAPAFAKEIEQFKMTEQQLALVLGAGGAARSVVYTLNKMGWQVIIAARSVPKATQFLHEMGYKKKKQNYHVTELSAHGLQTWIKKINLIVNTTPLGMSPLLSDTPWPKGLSFPEKGALFDLIYNPPQTKLMQEASHTGLYVRNGLGMLVEQAALAFETWTGLTAPREIMQKTILAKIGDKAHDE
jgi:shikimate dehydrogenase